MIFLSSLAAIVWETEIFPKIKSEIRKKTPFWQCDPKIALSRRTFYLHEED